MLPPLVITRVKYNDNLTYKVTYNNIWTFITGFEQMYDAENWEEVKKVLIPIERKKKLNSLLGIENKIYNNITFYQKKNY